MNNLPDLLIKPYTSPDTYQIDLITCYGEETSFWSSSETLLLDIVEEIQFNSTIIGWKNITKEIK